MELVLIGFMGSGKTTVSQLLAQKLQKQVVDLDQEIIRQEGKTINEIFALDGEEHFREVEHQLLVATAAQTKTDILATGGGTPMRADNAQFLKQQAAPVILLTASPQVTWSRLHGDEQRPLARQLNVTELAALKAKRAGRYTDCADFEVITDNLTPTEVVAKIETFLATWSN